MTERKRVKKVNTEDLAEASGVSLSTVGRVLQNNPKVRKEKRDRVFTAIHENKYDVTGHRCESEYIRFIEASVNHTARNEKRAN